MMNILEAALYQALLTPKSNVKVAELYAYRAILYRLRNLKTRSPEWTQLYLGPHKYGCKYGCMGDTVTSKLAYEFYR